MNGVMNKKISVIEEVDCTGLDTTDSPATRYKHAACVHQRYIYVHGGIDRNLSHKDLWRYNIDLCFWEKVKVTGDTPRNLQSHTLTGYKGFLYAFGGNFWFDGSSDTPLWKYEINTKCWTKHAKSKVEEPSPCSRRCHSAVLFADSLYIYGGYIDIKGSTEEFWSFNLESEKWRLLKFEGGPGPRHSHTSVLHKDAMWLCGGMSGLKLRTDTWCYHFGTHSWLRVKQSGPELVEHSAVSLESHMAVYGGVKDGQPNRDLWLFSYDTQIWQKLSHSTLPAVSHHALVLLPVQEVQIEVENPAYEHQPNPIPKSDSKLFRNKVLPFDSCNTPSSNQKEEKSEEIIPEPCAKTHGTKLAWADNSTSRVTYDSNLSLNLKHYTENCIYHHVTGTRAVPERHLSVLQTQSWDSGLSESDPLIKSAMGKTTTPEERLREHRGFVNTAYMNTSQSISSLESDGVLRERQHKLANLQCKQCVTETQPVQLQQGVVSGNFRDSQAQDIQVFASNKGQGPQYFVEKSQEAIKGRLNGRDKRWIRFSSSFDCEDLILENIENISDDSVTAEILPRRQISNLSKSCDSVFIDQHDTDQMTTQSFIMTNQSLICILGGRLERRKDFTKVKNMNMWTFQIKL